MLLALAALQLAHGATIFNLKIDNKWYGDLNTRHTHYLCGTFNITLSCPNTCKNGCQLDVTDYINDKGSFRNFYEVEDNGLHLGSTPVYSNPLIPARAGVNPLKKFPAYDSFTHEDFSAASFHIDHGKHMLRLTGSSLLDAQGDLYAAPKRGVNTACAYLRATCSRGQNAYTDTHLHKAARAYLKSPTFQYFGANEQDEVIPLTPQMTAHSEEAGSQEAIADAMVASADEAGSVAKELAMKLQDTFTVAPLGKMRIHRH